MSNSREELDALLDELHERTTFNRISTYKPYPFQLRFMTGKDYSGNHAAQKLAMCANRIGKTYTGANETSYHLTGLYPDWWEGKRFNKPINAWASGVSNESTRDILQNELLGPPDDSTMRGSGAIPRKHVGATTRKPQVPHAVQSVLVQHHDSDGKPDGWSRLGFKAFEMGQDKFMGTAMDWIWLDEQPPQDIFTQCVTRTADTGGIVAMTFTPEDGMTPVVHQFMHEIKPGQHLTQATWDDAPHLTEEVKNQILAVYSPHEREMRTRGIPIMGSGMVFPLHLEEDMTVEPFEVPHYWPAIAALDFGWDHPTAVVWLRWDRDADIVYVVDTYRQKQATAVIHAAAINARPRCPVSWPHDGYQHDKGSGISLADQYREQGVQMTPLHFTNPLAQGEKGTGNFKIEPGINAMYQRMEQGRFKVFSTCFEWFEEFRMYHREEGKIYPLNDDLMSATRYAHQSLRWAEEPTSGSFLSGYNRPLEMPDMGFLA